MGDDANATSKMHRKQKITLVWNKILVERGIPHIPNWKGAMQKAWITAPYQKWPKKMPAVLPPPLWCAHKLHKQFSTLCSSKMNFFNFFFDILTIHNSKIFYVKHVSDPRCVFFTLFGCGGGGGHKGAGAQPSYAFFHSQLKNRNFQVPPLSSRCLANRQ